jgi:hypothetical protein
MPIGYFHGNVAPYLLAARGQGAQQLAEREQDQALRAAQLAEQQRQFDSNMAFRQGALGYDRERELRNIQVGRQREADQFQRQMALGQMDFQNRAALTGLQHDFGQKDIALQNQLYMDRIAAQEVGDQQLNEQRFQFQQAEDAEASVKEALRGFRQMPLSDDGKQRLHALSQQWRALLGKRDSMRPHQWAQAASQFMDLVEDESLGDEVQEPVTIPKLIEDNQIWADPNTGDVWGVRNRNGVQEPVLLKPGDKIDPKDPFGDPQKQFKEARARLIEKQRNADGYKEGATITEPSDDDILKEMQDNRKRLQSIMDRDAVAMGREQASPPPEQAAAEPKVKPLPRKAVPLINKMPTYQSKEEVAMFMADSKAKDYFIFNGGIYYKINSKQAQYISPVD